MQDVLTLIHVLAFSIGFGGSVAAVVVSVHASRADASDRLLFDGLQAVLGQIEVVCIVLLWITGLWMFFGRYHGDAADLGLPFAIKILAVIVATIASFSGQYVGIRFRQQRLVPPARLMRCITSTTLISMLIAIVLAVLAFG